MWADVALLAPQVSQCSTSIAIRLYDNIAMVSTIRCKRLSAAVTNASWRWYGLSNYGVDYLRHRRVVMVTNTILTIETMALLGPCGMRVMINYHSALGSKRRARLLNVGSRNAEPVCGVDEALR